MSSLATKKIGSIVLGLIAAVILGIAGAKILIEQVNSPDVEQLIRQGDQQLNSNNYSEALRLYLEAEQIKPKSNEIRDKIKKVDEIIKNLQAANKPPGQNAGGQSANNGQAPISSNGTLTAEQLTQNGSEKSAPNLIGLSLDQAQQILLQKGIHYQYFIEASNEPPNTVYKQSIDPGQPYQPGERITFYVSRGQ